MSSKQNINNNRKNLTLFRAYPCRNLHCTATAATEMTLHCSKVISKVESRKPSFEPSSVRLIKVLAA